MKRVCVFCASRTGKDPIFREAATALGAALAGRGLGLVYGGAHVGLMGAVADAALAGGGEVVGVIPSSMVDREVARRGLTQLHVVRTMHERKALMADLSDAFVALPGGYGTLDEFFEALTWSQLGYHSKPCAVLNVGGFFDPLLAYLDGAVDAGLLHLANRRLIIVATGIDEVLDRIAEPPAARADKWS